jgi:hypothetical protein
MGQKINVDPNKVGGIPSSSPFLVFLVRHQDADACEHLRPYPSNIDYRVVFVLPHSSKEDVTSVSIVGWIVNRWIVS